MVTSAVFAPHPDLIVPQETLAEKPEADRHSLDSTDSETIPSGSSSLCHLLTSVLNEDRCFSAVDFCFLCRSPENGSHRSSALR